MALIAHHFLAAFVLAFVHAFVSGARRSRTGDYDYDAAHHGTRLFIPSYSYS